MSWWLFAGEHGRVGPVVQAKGSVKGEGGQCLDPSGGKYIFSLSLRFLVRLPQHLIDGDGPFLQIRLGHPTIHDPRVELWRTKPGIQSSQVSKGPATVDPTREGATHQQLFRRLSILGFFSQAIFDESFGLDGVLVGYGGETGCGFIDDMLEEVEDAHIHPTATAATAIPGFWFAWRFRSCYALGPVITVFPTSDRPSHLLQVGIVIVVVVVIIRIVVSEGESTECELDQRDAERPNITLDRVIPALNSFGLERA